MAKKTTKPRAQDHDEGAAAQKRFQFRSRHRLYGVAGVSFHGHVFSTTDPAVAARLRANPDFGSVFHEIDATFDDAQAEDQGEGEGEGETPPEN